MAGPIPPNEGSINTLERVFQRVLTPFEQFIHRESAGSLVLAVCTLLALIIANSPLESLYHHVLNITLGLCLAMGQWGYHLSLHQIINDGLMALFFFVVGLEIKRELLVGSLSSPRRALMPAVAALGGMIVPAAIYLLINLDGLFPQGWGVPMATDIAFALGVLMFLGARVPHSVLAFLVALAIVDDLGAVVVIALFYTGDLSGPALLVSLALVGLLTLCNLAGVRFALPYFSLGVLLWAALQAAGIHATLAGVATAFAIPARPRHAQVIFSAQVRDLMNRFDGFEGDDRADLSILGNQIQFSILSTLRQGIRLVETPLQRLENILHLPVALVVVPLFALANAGIPLESSVIAHLFVDPTTLGIILGLVLGKPIGIIGFSWFAQRLGLCHLPDDSGMYHLVGVGLLGGIGFTMSIFVAELGFRLHPEVLDLAKTAVLFASLVSGLAGWLWFRLVIVTNHA